MSGRKLDAAYASHRLQSGALDYAKEAALRNSVTPDLLERLGLGDLRGAVTKDRRKALLERFERAGRQIRRQAFVDLVSAFESDVFRLLGMAASKARHVLNMHYEADYRFAADRDRLVRTADEVSNLGGYRRLFASTSASRVDSRRDLWVVIAYRDYLAHGERWAPPAIPPTVDLAYRTLSDELDRVDGAG